MIYSKIKVTSPTVTADTVITEIIELHPQEIELIKAIRNKWRYGEITILARNGLPYRMVRVQEFINLDKPDG